MSIDCPKCSGSGGGPDPATSCSVCEGVGWLDTDEDRAIDVLIIMSFLDIDIYVVVAKANQGRPHQ